MAVSDISRVDEILKRIEDLTSLYVKVGILSSADGEILMIANVHEFGCDIPVTNKMRVFFLHNFGFWTKKDVIKIPERSFIRTSFDENKDEIQTSGEDLIDMVIDGSLEVYKFYEILGETSVNAIKKFIIEGIDPPITQLTIDNKKGKSTPLINTSRLINAVDYEIVGG
ncbi:hypothetical protein PEPTYR26121_01498 [Peptoniphilus tyrrelliae]|nr:hypothetical protein PEPTYR26121_01498 [Peptoniphilus tyrrelliae]